LIGLIISASILILSYYLTSLGHSIIEKSGVLNLAIDGLFVLGVAIAYSQAVYTGNDIAYSLLLTAVFTALIGVVITYIVTKLPVSHGAIGLSTMFLAYGIAGVIGYPARMIEGGFGVKIGYQFPVDSPLFILIYVVIMITSLTIYTVLEKTKLGSMIKACGEDPMSAEALGVNVMKTRLIAGLIGYSLIGLGSGVFELFYSRMWREGHGIGHGWICFAISLSSGRHPLLSIITAVLFGLLYEFKFVFVSIGLPRELAEATPFITAILSITVYMATPLRYKLAPPKNLGKPFFKEERTV